MKLNFPEYPFRIKKDANQKEQIWDALRKKYVRLTPEEWVRQHVVQYLIQEREVPAALINIESEIKLHGNSLRTDVCVHSRSGEPKIIVECKAPSVKLNAKVFEQISIYNLKLKVEYLLVTNGLQLFCTKINPKTNTYEFIQRIPLYSEL